MENTTTAVATSTPLTDDPVRLQEEIARLRAKITLYEQDYILVCFDMAEQDGLDLRLLVAEAPGKNCVQVYVNALREQRDANKPAPEIVVLPLIQADSRFLRIGNDTDTFRCACGNNLFTRYEKDGITKYRCTGCSASYHEPEK